MESKSFENNEERRQFDKIVTQQTRMKATWKVKQMQSV